MQKTPPVFSHFFTFLKKITKPIDLLCIMVYYYVKSKPTFSVGNKEISYEKHIFHFAKKQLSLWTNVLLLLIKLKTKPKQQTITFINERIKYHG